MRIAIISHLKHPIAKPYCGGLEMFTHAFTSQLVDRGHDVTLFASGDSDPALPVEPVIDRSTLSRGGQRHCWVKPADVDSHEDTVYQRLMERLLEGGYDLVHNHSLNPVPLRYGSLLPMPMTTTLHVPPLPRLVEELRSLQLPAGQFVNISRSNARRWQSLLPRQHVIHNGVDTNFWHGPRRTKLRRAIWFGRILPDKGLHLAVEAAHRAGLPIDIVGPIDDEAYFDSVILPQLSPVDQFYGHRPHEALKHLISRAAVALVTPCWDEPFGLVVAEALACGTPVAGFARGALPEIINPAVGRLVAPGDVAALGRAALAASRLSGQACRRLVRRHFSLERMMDRYEALYRRTCVEAAA